MAYHSAFKEEDAAAFACGCAVLPIKTSCRGPAPSLAADKEDIIDEVLFYFKANVLFRNFEVRGPADRLLVYLTLYVTECLKKIESAPSRADATKSLTNMALELFTIPGDANFALAPYFPAPENKQEAGACASRDRTRGFLMREGGSLRRARASPPITHPSQTL